MTSLPPPRFARPFETIGVSSPQGGGVPSGLSKTPPLTPLPKLGMTGGSSHHNNNNNNNNNMSSTTPAAADNNNMSQQQQQEQHALAIKETAQRDKAVLMHRIEELSRTIQELQRRSSAQTEELESYHRAFGTLDDFTSRQVRVREELVVLRDAVRQWQDREADARKETSQLQKVLDGIRRGQRHTSGESRAKDIEERLALAHLQRSEIEHEIEDIVEMERTKRERHAVLIQRTAGLAQGGQRVPEVLAAELAAAAPGVDGSYLNWQMRGKLADMRRLLRQKDDAIESLQKAADSLQSVAKSDRFESVGEFNRPCPGCGELPWRYPFCPETGRQHLGYDAAKDKALEQEKENVVRAPVFISLSEDDITARVKAWLDNGEWTMLKEVSLNDDGTERKHSSHSSGGGGSVLYRERSSGKFVEDLRAVVEQQHQADHEARVVEYEKKLQDERLRREAEEIEAAKDPVPALAVQPSLKSEILKITAALEQKKDENMRLRALLEAVANSGMVGVQSDIAALATMSSIIAGENDPSATSPGGAPPLSPEDDDRQPGAGGPPVVPGQLSAGSYDSSSAELHASGSQSLPHSKSHTFAPFGSGRVFPTERDRASPHRKTGGQPGGDGNEEFDIVVATSSNPNDLTMALHDEDDVQSFTKQMRLQRENMALSKRCSELVLALVERDDHVNQLRESLTRNNAVDNDRYVSQLRRESAQLRDRLLQEERRSANLEEEVRRLKRFEPRAFHQQQPARQ